MYNFVDTIENTTNTRPLPAEALYINGVCIEIEIEGYTTLTVSGREAFDMLYSENKIGNNLYLEDYYQDSRIIEVEYQLMADTPENLMLKFNKLNGLLNFKEAKIRFGDEPDKYYIGTKTASEIPPKGRLNIVSTFQIYCPDPHKYSSVTKQFPASLNADGILEATIINEGTADVPVNYEIKHKHDNGYLGIVSEYGVIQIGKILEVDGYDYKQAEQLFSTVTFSEFDRDTGTDPENPDRATDGKLAKVGIDDVPGLILQTPSTSMGWGGGMVTMTIPDNSEGKKPVNWWSYFNICFEAHQIDQIGCMIVRYLDADDNVICSYTVEKNSATNSARVIIRIGGKVQHRWDFTPSANDKENTFTRRQGHCDMTKEGATITGTIAGTRKGATIPELENVACHKVQLYIGQHSAGKPPTRSYFKLISLRDNIVEKWSDIPNRYPKDSEVKIDGQEGKIYANGILRMDDEIKGSQYFMVPPGETKIQFYYSNFSDPPPEITAEIREAWL